jgi:hypothetical protein
MRGIGGNRQHTRSRLRFRHRARRRARRLADAAFAAVEDESRITDFGLRIQRLTTGD